MGLLSAFYDADAAHDSKKPVIRLFWLNSPRSKKLTPPHEAKKEKKTAESLLLKAEVGNLKKKLTTATQAVFQLYANLLTEKAYQSWGVVIKEQTELLPQTKIFGVKQRKSPAKMSKSLLMSQLLHLQSCYSHDTGENLWFYTMNFLKKLTRFAFVSLCSTYCN